MVKITQGKHRNMNCVWMKNSYVSLAIAVERGLRAVYFSKNECNNIFAELEGMDISSQHGKYELIGGHRLWHSPEWAPRTYYPEPKAFQVTVSEQSVEVCAPSDGTGIAKTLKFEMSNDKPQVIVQNILQNEGLWQIELSPWAITQCRLGGIVLCPEWAELLNNNNGIPNRCWVFWHFTDINDHRLQFGNSMSLIKAEAGPPTKVGYHNLRGWIGYWLDEVIFTKHFNPFGDKKFPDMGCNTEIYACDDFVEIETLAPLTKLNPNDSVTHTEIWTLWDGTMPTIEEFRLTVPMQSIPDFGAFEI